MDAHILGSAAAAMVVLALLPVTAPAGVAIADGGQAVAVEQVSHQVAEQVSEQVGHMPPTTYRGGMSDATGKKTIEAEAKRLGVAVTWKHLDGAAGRYTTGSAKIVVDPDARRMRAADAKTVVRHETAHYRIAKTCGRVNPPIAGGRFENVTDAYAHHYVGALSYRGYGWSAADKTTAARIKSGTCMSGQTTKTVAWSGMRFYGINGSATYTVARGARMTVVGPRSNGYVLVRDGSGRIGHLDPVAWAKVSKTLTVKAAGHPVYSTDRVRVGQTTRGATFGYVRSWDAKHYLVRSSTMHLRLVPKQAF